jgi:hypothetical protein
MATAALAAAPVAHAQQQVKASGYQAGQAAYWTNNTQPASGDDMYVRNAMHGQARATTGKLFAALQGLLHGNNPDLNFVSGDSPLVATGGGTSANFDGSAGQAANSINMAPNVVAALTNPSAHFHDWSVQIMPHEMAHLRQTPAVLGQMDTREGGAQAFADQVTYDAAQKAGVPFFAGKPGTYDSNYADFVNAINALGKNWALYTQFGNPVSS